MLEKGGGGKLERSRRNQYRSTGSKKVKTGAAQVEDRTGEPGSAS